MLFLRPLRYAAHLSSPEDGVFGAGPHTDYGLLTILATDGTPGLQVFHNDRWFDVPYVGGSLLINLGDMAERCGAVADLLVLLCAAGARARELECCWAFPYWCSTHQ
jgi:hypothetical protein